MRSLLIACAAALALSACAEPPAPVGAGPESATTPEPMQVRLAVTQGWTRATPAGATAAGGFLLIENPTIQSDRLLSAATSRAGRTEIHEMADVSGVMTMRPLTGLDIPATGQVSLQPGGLHLMFFDLTGPFAEGETVPVTLTFQNAGVIETALEVRALEGAPAAAAPAPAEPDAAAPGAAAPAAGSTAPAAPGDHNHGG